MIYRSKAPLRIGLSGGGTDVSPYSDKYGGSILNATIDLYARANIEPRNDNKIVFHIPDKNEEYVFDSKTKLEINGDKADLMKGAYNRIVSEYTQKPLSFTLTCSIDAPFGTGLGTSSTWMIAILGAFVEWLSLPLGYYDIALLGYKIERLDLQQVGGKQDQYAATFGGFNFMEFNGENKVIVNPLRIDDETCNELSNNLLLCSTKITRSSSKIIKEQQKNVIDEKAESVEAMHFLKAQSVQMKEALLKKELDKIGEILQMGWEYKKRMAHGISTPILEEVYSCALKAGATGGKISGAGGGGYIFFYCPGNTRFDVIRELKKINVEIQDYNFTQKGLETWTSR